MIKLHFDGLYEQSSLLQQHEQIILQYFLLKEGRRKRFPEENKNVFSNWKKTQPFKKRW